MQPVPTYPLVQCLNGTHPPFNIEQHPNGCPAHRALAEAKQRVQVAMTGAEARTLHGWLAADVHPLPPVALALFSALTELVAALDLAADPEAAPMG